MPPVRRIALVGALTDTRRVVHTAGYPIDPDRMLPTPDVLLIVDAPRSGCMLFRYTAHGELCGDTPHDNASQAETQAMIEYGEALGYWIEVPDDVADAHHFAISYAADQLNQRD
jgi:hypothetical protein